MTTKQFCDCCGREMTGQGTDYIDATYYSEEYCRLCALAIGDVIDQYKKSRKPTLPKQP